MDCIRIPRKAVLDGAPDGGVIFRYFATTDADILAIDRVAIVSGAGPHFQVPPPFGSDVEPAPQAFIDLKPSLYADTWITTPGPTSQLGPSLPGDGSLTTFGDLTNDGPQTKFQFAQLTFPPPQTFFFNFRFQLAGPTGPEFFEFALPLDLDWEVHCHPEPAGWLLALLACPLLLKRRMARYGA